MEQQTKVFDVLVIEETGQGEQKKSYWRNVGVGFLNRDGSINLQLYMFQGLKLQVRERKDKQ